MLDQEMNVTLISWRADIGIGITNSQLAVSKGVGDVKCKPALVVSTTIV